jgi:hypothetical protein
MGDPSNIVEEFFERAGQTDAIGKAGILLAKQHMLELLQAELEAQELERPKPQY